MARAYLSLGGNVGDTKAYFARAIERLASLGRIGAISSFYRTEPVGVSEQPDFLNGTLSLDTELLPEQLLGEVKKIERELGRTPSIKNGPREIDIDVLLYDDVVLHEETLTLPHPRMHERRFVLTPLAEIAPGAVHPVFKKTTSELLAALSDPHAVTMEA